MKWIQSAAGFDAGPEREVRSGSRGFTLVEIMIVVTILGLLASISYPSYQQARENAQKSVCQQSQKVIREASEMFLFENPGVERTLVKRDLREYFRNGDIPRCPAGGRLRITRPRINDIRVHCTYNGGEHTLDDVDQ